MRRLFADGAQELAFEFDGQTLRALHGDTVANALLVNGIRAFRQTPVSGAARGPFCLMGACFECLVEIDGVPNRQACMVQLQAGMRIKPMHGARDVDGEVAS